MDPFSIIIYTNTLFKDKKWLKVNLHFLLDKKSIIISLGDEEYKIVNVDLPQSLSPEIFFGRNEHIIDVPAFALSNLQIRGQNKTYTFPLKESEGTQVHDEHGTLFGRVANARWLINESYFWKHLYSYTSQTVSGATFDESKNTIHFFNSDSIVSYNLSTKEAEHHRFLNAAPVDIRLGTNFIDSLANKLYVYEVNNLPDGDITIASLDIGQSQWNAVSKAYLPMQLHHHTGYYDKTKERYIAFGGFGNQRYNKEFLAFDIATNKWDTLHFAGDKITPRYFTSMTSDAHNQNLDAHNQNLYVFGGMGNVSGDQTIGYQYFYDLYKIDLQTNRITKLWDIHLDKEEYVPVRQMVMQGESSLYTLCYPEHIPSSYLQLYEFSVLNGNFRILGDSIPIQSEKIGTNANLYYSKKLNEFYCVVQEFADDIVSETRVYSLSAPPISRAELMTYNDSKSGADYPIYILFLVLMLISLGTFYIYRRRKYDKISPSNTELGARDVIEKNADRKNAIYLFGDFTLYDKQGKDITYMLSTRLRLAFLLILQHSLKDGISSQQFSEALWPDRVDYNVKNLRGVTLNQLRKVLAELDGLELIHEKGMFKLVVGDQCYCDCWQFLSLLESNANFSSSVELKDILSRGKFLKSEDETILHSFKEKVEARILYLLPIDLENAYNEDFELTIQLSDLLFATNSLNEIALYYKINSLAKLYKDRDAKKQYALYTSEYLKQTGQEYKYSYNALLKNKIETLFPF